MEPSTTHSASLFSPTTTANLINLLIKTIDAQGKQQLYSFNVIVAHGSLEYSSVQVLRTAAKTNSIGSTLSTPKLLERVEAGIQVAIERRYATKDDPLFERVRQFTADARSGTPVAIAAKRANVSSALLLKLSQLGLQAIR